MSENNDDIVRLTKVGFTTQEAMQVMDIIDNRVGRVKRARRYRTVYVLITGSYEEKGVAGVFSTEERAMEWYEKNKGHMLFSENPFVEVFDIDKGNE